MKQMLAAASGSVNPGSPAAAVTGLCAHFMWNDRIVSGVMRATGFTSAFDCTNSGTTSRASRSLDASMTP